MMRLKEEQTSGVQSESEEKKGTVDDEKTSEEKDMSAGQKVGVTTGFYFHVSPDVTLYHFTLVPDIMNECSASMSVEGGLMNVVPPSLEGGLMNVVPPSLEGGLMNVVPPSLWRVV